MLEFRLHAEAAQPHRIGAKPSVRHWLGAAKRQANSRKCSTFISELTRSGGAGVLGPETEQPHVSILPLLVDLYRPEVRWVGSQPERVHTDTPSVMFCEIHERPGLPYALELRIDTKPMNNERRL